MTHTLNNYNQLVINTKKNRIGCGSSIKNLYFSLYELQINLTLKFFILSVVIMMKKNVKKNPSGFDDGNNFFSGKKVSALKNKGLKKSFQFMRI
jgi:hypothetical protein